MEATYSSQMSLTYNSLHGFISQKTDLVKMMNMPGGELCLRVSQLQLMLEVAMNGMFTARGDRRHIQQHIFVEGNVMESGVNKPFNAE
jgi:hypothetical protein